LVFGVLEWVVMFFILPYLEPKHHEQTQIQVQA
jgi:hypothetical protein